MFLVGNRRLFVGGVVVRFAVGTMFDQTASEGKNNSNYTKLLSISSLRIRFTVLLHPRRVTVGRILIVARCCRRIRMTILFPVNLIHHYLRVSSF